MLKTLLHLLERLSSAIHLFYCFRENFKSTSRLTECPTSLKTPSIRSRVSCDLLVRENILCSSLQKIEKQLDLQVHKTLSSCQKIKHGIWRHQFYISDLKHHDERHDDGIPEVFFPHPLFWRSVDSVVIPCKVLGPFHWFTVFFLRHIKTEVLFWYLLLNVFEDKFHDEHPWSWNMR